LIEKYPVILAGDQINPVSPRKWILISREMGVPLDDNIGRLDHLYIDQDSIPTFLEVKRCTDTRIRREVVGQMLDYVANGIQLWSIRDLRDIYDRNLREGGTASLSDIGVEDEEKFWKYVDTNLRIGRVRLLFVADVIPTSLQSIIEFLNSQMHYAEVYGVEIKQFVGEDGSKTLVPNLIGRTTTAIQAKSGDIKQKYANRDEFFESVESQRVKELYIKLFAFADDNKYKIGLGTAGFSFNIFNSDKKSITLFYGYGIDAQWENRKNCIETTFLLSTEMNEDVLEYYMKAIEEFSFFEQTPGGKNYKWQLCSDSTDEEMQQLIGIIKDIHNRTREIGVH